MRQRIKILTLKLVISFSFVLIFSGFYLLIGEKANYHHLSPEDVTVVANDPNSETDIAITTTEEKPIDDSTSNTTEIPNETEKSPDYSEQTPQQEIPKQSEDDPLVIENNQLRETIENTYGIKIKYGSEVGNYTANSLTTTQQTDPVVINQALTTIKNELALYPDGFIKETTDIGLKLNLYVIKKYSQDYVTGITDSRNINIIISLATDYSIKDTIHHELFHYIENYLLNVDGTFTSWNSLNPNDFVYNHKNSSYTCNIYDPINAKFVNDYAQTNDYEDRASTFEFMMKDSKSSCFLPTNTVGIKANYIATQLDQFFQSVNSHTTEHWERFL